MDTVLGSIGKLWMLALQQPCKASVVNPKLQLGVEMERLAKSPKASSWQNCVQQAETGSFLVLKHSSPKWRRIGSFQELFTYT